MSIAHKGVYCQQHPHFYQNLKKIQLAIFRKFDTRKFLKLKTQKVFELFNELRILEK